FDWNRTDEQGLSRELHVIEALEAIHFDDEQEYKIDYEEKNNGSCPIIRNDYFNINLIKLKEPLQKNYHTIDSFVIYMCVTGEVHFLTEPHGEGKIEILIKGEVLLKPACMENLDLVPIGDSKLLEVYVSVKN
ncbi:MAG: hypothetical protein LBU51_08440, partial [Bacteroidales bacterium]|nr:hypothetical protein [Bacteroidales bacterium]